MVSLILGFGMFRIVFIVLLGYLLYLFIVSGIWWKLPYWIIRRTIDLYFYAYNNVGSIFGMHKEYTEDGRRIFHKGKTKRSCVITPSNVTFHIYMTVNLLLITIMMAFTLPDHLRELHVYDVWSVCLFLYIVFVSVKLDYTGYDFFEDVKQIHDLSTKEVVMVKRSYEGPVQNSLAPVIIVIQALTGQIFFDTFGVNGLTITLSVLLFIAACVMVLRTLNDASFIRTNDLFYFTGEFERSKTDQKYDEFLEAREQFKLFLSEEKNEDVLLSHKTKQGIEKYHSAKRKVEQMLGTHELFALFGIRKSFPIKEVLDQVFKKDFFDLSSKIMKGEVVKLAYRGPKS